jgi:hypothetical protein
MSNRIRTSETRSRARSTRAGKTHTTKVRVADLVLPPHDDSIARFICPKYIKKINTEQGLAAATRANLIQPLTPTSSKQLAGAPTSGSKAHNEASYQRSQRAMKAANDISIQQPALPVKVTRFDDSLHNLAETNRKLEVLMHKPRSQWTAEDKKLVAMTKSLK